ncbi:MutS family DNA mismatch repair protein [Neorhodopirellula pilleata]|uniref:DNA mismatch repair protein MutS n=1 Tax=Neorhodopirellula pilleata TaxID=2714738 RepID=A0A5C6AAX6_9BACT|nr:MutS family DNA mismatch repair protein [Neorhodopirellula pilleata]TWT96560.1 DNA mismatch repair protein MutS [Neorhodopirellula pilleata]
MSHSSSGDNASTRYADQLASIDSELQTHQATDGRLGSLRVGLFFIFVIALAFAVSTQQTFWAVVAVAGLVAFLVVVVHNETVRDKIGVLQNRTRTLRRLVRRLDRDWKSLAKDPLGNLDATSQPDSGLQLDARQKALAGDLDLLGNASLFQLVSMAATMPGRRTLASWLTQPVLPPVAIDRHIAVRSLAPLRDDRIRFYTLAREVGTSTGDPDSFVRWAGGPMWLPGRRWLLTWGRSTAVIAIATVLGLIYAILSQDRDLTRVTFFALIAIAVVNLLLASWMLGPVAEIFSIALASRRSVDDYAELFDSAKWLPESESGDTSAVASIRENLLGTDANSNSLAASNAMRELSGIAAAASLKHSAATFLVYLPLQAFGLWDVEVLRRLEDWKQRYGDQAQAWFRSLGELESLLSLAALADEYPDWASPTWLSENDTDSTITCVGLGHPLLPDASRVRNDVTIGPTGTLLLVTGSNMSGKSTMLRSLGLNVSLAMAGGPVCCESMRLPPVEMATSIRVSDDLSQGVSFYMAELNRLAAVVGHARELAAQPDRRLLFLLDEILQGTNSRERQIAVTRVLGMLIQSGAIGAITTHDLELADEPELLKVAHTVHFRETITPDASGDERMTFDYRMRQGVSPTTNALRLLEMVGLGEEK